MILQGISNLYKNESLENPINESLPLTLIEPWDSEEDDEITMSDIRRFEVGVSASKLALVSNIEGSIDYLRFYDREFFGTYLGTVGVQNGKRYDPHFVFNVNGSITCSKLFTTHNSFKPTVYIPIDADIAFVPT